MSGAPYLTDAERHSSCWVKLMTLYAGRLAGYRSRLENPRISESERIELCWRIAAIKELCALADPGRNSEAAASD